MRENFKLKKKNLFSTQRCEEKLGCVLWGKGVLISEKQIILSLGECNSSITKCQQ